MYFFIVNQASRTGKTRKIWRGLKQELEKREIRYQAYVTKYRGHAGELAKKLCSRGVELRKKSGERVCLVVVGGDGTANEVINGMHHFEQIWFGYIPSGSGNDLRRGLGIEKDPLLALRAILAAVKPCPMDLGSVTDETGKSRYFAISSGIGIDADVCRMALTSKLKKALNYVKLGSLTYLLLTVKALCSMPVTQAQIRFDDGEVREMPRMIFVAGMNHPWEGGGVPMAPRASAADGKLSVCCVHGIPRFLAFFLLPLLAAGKHEGHRGFEIVDCERYELRLAAPMVLHADGEYLGEQRRICYVCEKGKLQVLR